MKAVERFRPSSGRCVERLWG